MESVEHSREIQRYALAIAELLESLEATSYLEAGVGEATTLTHVVRSGVRGCQLTAGFDLSWSRVHCGQVYANSHDAIMRLFVGDLFSIPLPDNAFDVVYTSHSIEPNHGREVEVCKLCCRVFPSISQIPCLLSNCGVLGSRFLAA